MSNHFLQQSIEAQYIPIQIRWSLLNPSFKVEVNRYFSMHEYFQSAKIFLQSLKVVKYRKEILMSYIFQTTNANIFLISALASKTGRTKKIKGKYFINYIK
jgi:hypothetical protein